MLTTAGSDSGVGVAAQTPCRMSCVLHVFFYENSHHISIRSCVNRPNLIEIVDSLSYAFVSRLFLLNKYDKEEVFQKIFSKRLQDLSSETRYKVLSPLMMT